jgi:predicted small lipoprotein YifL
MKYINILIFISLLMSLSSCGLYRPTDAKEFPPDPKLRVQKNLEEGRGFKLMNEIGGRKGTNFEFASSNELWRATLDTIDFMPLTTANYSGGIIVTDWYSDNENLSESLKITVRFLSNEIRSDALDLKIFYKKCNTRNVCSISEGQTNLNNELKKQILKKASIYKTQSNTKK